MNPEKLKVIAEGMGYEAKIEGCITHLDELSFVLYRKPEWKSWLEYNPDTTNNDQMVEIIVKNGTHTSPVADGQWRAYSVKSKGHSIGKTINEAVCKDYYLYCMEGKK